MEQDRAVLDWISKNLMIGKSGIGKARIGWHGKAPDRMGSGWDGDSSSTGDRGRTDTSCLAEIKQAQYCAVVFFGCLKSS